MIFRIKNNKKPNDIQVILFGFGLKWNSGSTKLQGISNMFEFFVVNFGGDHQHDIYKKWILNELSFACLPFDSVSNLDELDLDNVEDLEQIKLMVEANKMNLL